MEAFLQRGRNKSISTLNESIFSHKPEKELEQNSETIIFKDEHVVSKRKLFSSTSTQSISHKQDCGPVNREEEAVITPGENKLSGQCTIRNITFKSSSLQTSFSLSESGSLFSSDKDKENVSLNRSLCLAQKENLLEQSSVQDFPSSSRPNGDIETEQWLLSSNSSLSSESDSSDIPCPSTKKRKWSTKGRKEMPSSDEDDTLMSLEEIMQLKSKPSPATPQGSLPDLSPFSSPWTPSQLNKITVATPTKYANNLSRLVKEKTESERLQEMEKKLQEDIQKGQGLLFPDTDNETDDCNLDDEHMEFVRKYSIEPNHFPDHPPGEDIFNLAASGNLFSHHTLDLRMMGCTLESSEENLIFSCDITNQLMLAGDGFLMFIYRYKTCPTVLMKWMFQMVAVHPSYTTSVKILDAMIAITSNNLSIEGSTKDPWIPSLLDVATVFFNMGVNFQTLFPVQHLQPSFCCSSLVSAIPVSVKREGNLNVPILQTFTSIPEMQITHVIKFLGFCTAVCPESYSDQENILLFLLVVKIYLERTLKYSSIVDLHTLLGNLLQNIKDWESKMPELSLALSDISRHHHNFVKVTQLIPAYETRGRQLKRHLSLILISNLIGENYKKVTLNYDSQMSFLCQCLVQMKPSNLIKKMQKNTEDDEQLNLDQKAYYLTFSLLNLVNDASSVDEGFSVQRKYLLRLCAALEKHIKCDIREGPRFYYRTKVKDLLARIHGKWQKLLHCSRPNQGRIHDFWETVSDNLSPGNSQDDNANDAPHNAELCNGNA
ncbi:hypothetical protein GDO86_013349 [Hymenochirus boettgeri]|uniref:Coiled-coil SMC6 And NSE5 INteracting (CANIN) domain-containing protein n=1 Tax=Hymenochirus boettgeri TaxID=247094 RepID=A0A8T2IWB1_9PIPI|nr:hypothetical protein GDO86_013349 [Hymenochirus boettgeri]